MRVTCRRRAAPNSFGRLDHVKKSRDGETPVVPKLHLKVGKGEALTTPGTPGSGKTTCLLMVAGTVSASLCAIWLDGRQIKFRDSPGQSTLTCDEKVRARWLPQDCHALVAA